MKAIEVDGITKSFGDRLILNDVTFSVDSGHIHGLLGPNGAGKTTTMKIITSLLCQNSGSIKVGGEKQPALSGYTHKDLGFLLDESPLYGDMSVEEYLTYVGKLRGLNKIELKESLDYCISKLDLNSVLSRSIENLSTGYKKRVGIAQALIHMPKILILDEPTSGLDPKSVKDIRELIFELKKNHTVIISSHLLHEMSLVCDEVTIIVDGKIKATGTLPDLRARNAKELSVELVISKSDDSFQNFLRECSGVVHIKEEVVGERVHYHLDCKNTFSMSPEIIKEAVKREINVFELKIREYTLEDIFIKVVES